MGRLGRAPEFFRFVEGSVSTRILERTRHALTELPTDLNPYLDYILTGNFTHVLPPYLDASRYRDLQDAVQNVELVHGSIDETAKRDAGTGFDGFNLSDIFEYLDTGLSEAIYSTLLDSAKSGARFAYWNMLVPRRCPVTFFSKVRYLEDLSKILHLEDRAWFYSAFHVEEVLG